LISPCYTRSDLAVSEINHLLQNINEHDPEQLARDLERSALAHRKAAFADIENVWKRSAGSHVIPMPESADLSPMTDRAGKGWFSMLCHRSELSGIGIRGC
jgi:hypothetical protein